MLFLVPADAIVISNLVFLQLGYLDPIRLVYSLCEIMEKSEHLTEVVAAHHCRVVIYLLILEEEVEQIF